MGKRKPEHEGVSDATARFIEVGTNAQREGPSGLHPTQ